MLNNTDVTMVSLLMATTPEREQMFGLLLNEVFRQVTYCKSVHPTLGNVEIVIDDSKRFLDGGLSIGFKRDALLRRAEGKYVCYLDSDEHISPDYVESLLRLSCEDKDVCTFRSLAKLANNWALVDMALENENEQINPFGITRRKPWHICPVRREFAQQFEFENISYGEDWNWFSQVLKLCQTESHTDKIIHQYTHGAHSEADKIK